MAVILAIYLDAERFDVGQVITFGQPKVTNIDGAEKLSHLDIIRVVAPLDVVPLVPPLDLLDINDIDVYWHVGKEVILLDGNQFAILQGVDSMMRATKFTQQPLDQGNVDHHSMAVYFGLIRTKLKSPRQVPYQVDLNLFNLFGVE